MNIKIDMKKKRNNIYKGIRAGLLLVIFVVLNIGNVWADGSKDLYPEGATGGRAFLRASTTPSLAYPFPTLGTHYVYAEAGEIIALASDAQTDTNKRIYLYNPNGIDVTPSPSNNVGTISNRAAELGGPRLPGQEQGGNRYLPIYYTVPKDGDGIYKVEFRGNSGIETGDGRYSYSSANSWPTTVNTRNYLRAWDISVAKQTEGQWSWVPGRTYTTVLNMDNPSYGGQNGTDNANFRPNSGFYGKFKVLTRDGYVYDVDNNGNQGISFTFMVNNRGFHKDGDPDTPSYQSIAAPNAKSVQDRYHDPRTADAAAAVTQKIFYNLPDGKMPEEASGGVVDGGKTWLRIPERELDVKEMRVVGAEGSSNQLGSKGAYVEFYNESGGDYYITISPKTGDSFPSKTLTGPSAIGENRVHWDGTDGNNEPLPSSIADVNVELKLRGAEVHFPYIDMELNANGIILKLLNTDLQSSRSDKVYWDDTAIGDGGGNNGYKSDPRNASHDNPITSGGISSITNGHKWGSNTNATSKTFGDEQGMDTWTFIEGKAVNVSLDVKVVIADLEVVKITPSKNEDINIGDEITYTIIIRNNGPSDVTNAPFHFVVPDGFVPEEDISYTFSEGCGTEVVGLSFDANTNTFKSELNLPNACEVTYTIKVKITESVTLGEDYTLKAGIMRPNDVYDPDGTNSSDPTKPKYDPNNPDHPKLEDLESKHLDEYFYPPFDPFFEAKYNGKKTSNNVKEIDVSVCEDVVFFENFGTSPFPLKEENNFGRKTSIYMPNNSFKFGTPYPTSTEYDEYMIDNNHYAVVAPGYIKGGTEPYLFYFWTPAYDEQNTVTDMSGTEEGAVLVINAGNTLLPFYHREATLESNTTYKASFWMYLVNSSAKVAIDIINKATGEVLGTAYTPDGTDNPNGPLMADEYQKKWVQHELYFSTPDITDCNLDEVFISIRNAHADDQGNDYFIDDIKLSKLVCDIPTTGVIEIKCPEPAKPIATPDINQTPMDIPVSGNVLTNDSGEGITVTGFTVIGADGNKHTVTIGTATEVYVPGGGKAGSITIGYDGKYTFTPTNGFIGTVPMEYTIKNNAEQTDSTTLTIEVIPNPDSSGNKPIAQDDAYTTVLGAPIESNILSNDSDVDGNTLTVLGAKHWISNDWGGYEGTFALNNPTQVSGVDRDGNPVHNAGTVTISEDGTITFVPEYGFIGEINPINYTISDGNGDTDDANIYINVLPDTGNTTFANDDANTGKKGDTLTGNVLINDNDPEGDTQTLTSVTIDGAEYTANGTEITINGKGKFTFKSDGSYTFIPESDFVGTVVVEQKVCDDGDPVACDNATLYLTILGGVSNSTNAVDDFYETGKNTSVSGNVKDNDYDLEGNTQTVTKAGKDSSNLNVIEENGSITFETVNEGKVTIDSNGNFTYTPPVGGFSGFDKFEYQVCDDADPRACDIAEVEIGVGICIEDVDGKYFKWSNTEPGDAIKEGNTLTKLIDQPATTYGFIFDIYDLDNSFNMEINGVKLAEKEIEFQKSGPGGQNIRFQDGTIWEQGGIPDIWNLNGDKDFPIVRVVISPTGKVAMYGSKTSYGELHRLVLFNGNKFNVFPFNVKTSDAAKNVENNKIKVTQNMIGTTEIEGYGYGANIHECPNYWYGNEGTDWDNFSNWTDNYVPEQITEDIEFATKENNSKKILGISGSGSGKGSAINDLYVPKDETKEIRDLINETKDVVGESEVKSLVIPPNSGLIIHGETKGSTTDPNKIVVKASENESTGTLIFKDPNNNKDVQATVEFYNQAYDCADCGYFTRSWQYFGIPVSEAGFPYLSPQMETINEWMENENGNKWVPVTTDLKAFRGYEMTNRTTVKPDHIYQFQGKLNVGNATVALTKSPAVNYSGMNLIGNSFTAAIPINSDAIKYSDTNWDGQVYLFNTGTRDEWRKLNGGTVNHDTQSGQYKVVPLRLAGQAGLNDKVPSMHTFMVNAPSSGTITLAYDKLVKNELVDGKAWRSAEQNDKQEIPHIVLDVIGTQSADRVWLFEQPGTTRGFDNGWDGVKMPEKDIVQIYVAGEDANENYQVATVPQLVGTSFGLNTVNTVETGHALSNQSQLQLHMAVSPDVEIRGLYLRDMLTGRSYALKNGAEYRVSGSISSDNRFKVVDNALDESKLSDNPLIDIYVQDNQVVVANNSEEDCTVSLFDISGRLVAKRAVASNGTTYVSTAISGVYVVKVIGGTVNESKRVVVK